MLESPGKNCGIVIRLLGNVFVVYIQHCSRLIPLKLGASPKKLKTGIFFFSPKIVSLNFTFFFFPTSTACGGSRVRDTVPAHSSDPNSCSDNAGSLTLRYQGTMCVYTRRVTREVLPFINNILRTIKRYFTNYNLKGIVTLFKSKKTLSQMIDDSHFL